MSGQPDLDLAARPSHPRRLRAPRHRPGRGARRGPVRSTAAACKRLIDPNVDLAAIDDGLAQATWILPAPDEPPPHLKPIESRAELASSLVRLNDLGVRVVDVPFRYLLSSACVCSLACALPRALARTAQVPQPRRQLPAPAQTPAPRPRLPAAAPRAGAPRPTPDRGSTRADSVPRRRRRRPPSLPQPQPLPHRRRQQQPQCPVQLLPAPQPCPP